MGRLRRWAVLTAVFAASSPLKGQVVIPDTVQTQTVTLRVEIVGRGLEAPVAMTFLPDGGAILAERASGRLSLFHPGTGTLTEIATPLEVALDGDGGVLDIALHPEFSENRQLYLAYSALEPSGGTVTALGRARLEAGRLGDLEELFRSTPGAEVPSHYGGRIVILDHHLFMSVGDREPTPQPGRELAQSLGTHTGAILRLELDGAVPQGNPFVPTADALPEIWSYGHRNPQGLAVNPTTGTLWEHEHGPQGGDEVNLILRGRNYGWPRVTYGEEYGGGPVNGGLTTGQGFTSPIYFYRPSIAPSDLAFVVGSEFPEWEGRALIGAMGLEHLNLLTLDGDRVLHEERILEGLGWRIRMVEVDPQGRIYLGTDSGLLVRLSRANPVPAG